MIKFYTTILLLFTPLLLLSQSEIDEKVRKRSERNTPQFSVVETTPIIVPQNTVLYPYGNNFYNPYNPYVPYRSFRNTSGYYGNDYYGGNYNRTPIELNVKLGLLGGVSSPSSLGMYTTIGGYKNFIYLSYEGSRVNDYEHYDNITFEDVFNWGDEQIDVFERYTSFTIGVGGNVFEDINHFAGVNLNKTDKDLVFYDEYHILSDNGEYSINDSDKNDFGLVYGVLFDIRNINVGTSVYFLTKTRLNVHFGFNF